MKLRVLGSVLIGLLVGAVSAFAQQGTSEVRGRLTTRRAARCQVCR